jgi:membrane protease YdiL (CAAX protease family)
MRLIFLALALLSALSFLTVLSCTGMKGAWPLAPLCSRLAPDYTVVGSGAIHLGLLSAALFFLWDKDIRTTLRKLAFPGDLKNTVIYTVLCLVAMFTLLLVLGFASIMLGFNDQQKIVDKLSGLPWYVLALAVVIAPISEELFFRALLVPRIGIIASSVLFSVSHLAYGSVMEVVGVLAVGLVLGSTFRMSKSITPCITAHLIYNLLSIIVMGFI